MCLSLGLLESRVLLNFLLGRRHLMGGRRPHVRSKSDKRTKRTAQNTTCGLKYSYLRWGLSMEKVVGVVDVGSKEEGRHGAG